MHIVEAQAIEHDLLAIKNAQGTSAKKELAAHWKQPHHTEFLNMVGNKDLVYFVTWDTVMLCAGSPGELMDWDDIWYEASSRIATPSTTAARIARLLKEGWPASVLKAIVEKTPDCGLSTREFLKARGEQFKFLVGLAKDWCKLKHEKRVEMLAGGRYVSTPKMDGLRCLFVVIPGQYAVMSRQNKPLKNLEAHMDMLKEWFKDYPCIVDGEILSSDNSWNTTVTATKRAGAKVDAQFYPFDLIPASEFASGKYEMPKSKRWEIMDSRIDYEHPLFTYVHRLPVRTVEEVLEELDTCVSEGWEGTVLHDTTAVYMANPEKTENRTMAMVKVKLWLSSEFRVVNFVAGRGKHQGRLGAILIEGEYEGEKVACEVGGGFTDEIREDIWKNQSRWKGAIVEVKFFSLSKGTGDAKALRFPSFLRRRVDLE